MKGVNRAPGRDRHSVGGRRRTCPAPSPPPGLSPVLSRSGSQGVWLRGRGAGGGHGARPRRGESLLELHSPAAGNQPNPKPAPYSDVRRCDSRDASRGAGAGAGAHAWKWAGSGRRRGPRGQTAWDLRPLFTSWTPRNRSRLLSLLTVGGERLPGGLQGLIFPLHLHRWVMLPSSAAAGPGRAGQCRWFPPASGLGLGVRRSFPP